MTDTISEAEIKEYFSLVDSEGKGVIKGDQIEVLMRALGHNPTRAELASQKQVDLAGFLAIMPRKRTPITKDAVRQALETLEKYHGVVTKDGLKHLVKNVGDKLTDREWDEFIADGSVSVTSDGRINTKSAVESLGA